MFAQSEHMLDSLAKPDVVSRETVVDLARALGDWHAVRGEWQRSAQALFGRCSRTVRTRGSLPQCRIIALKLGDESGFFRLGDEAVSRFHGITDKGGHENVMQVSLLRPVESTSAAALEPFVQFLERAVASAGPLKEGTFVPASWDLVLLGLFEYRLGNYAKALDCCQRSLVTCTYMAMPAAADRVIRAMCFAKLADEASAHSELDGAKSLVQSGLNIGYDRWNWPAWIFVRLLIEEADALIPQRALLIPAATPR